MSSSQNNLFGLGRRPMARWSALLLLGTVTCIRSAQGANDSAATTAPLTGTWTNLAADAGRASIAHAVESSIEDLFALGKPTARSRLLAANPAIGAIEIVLSETSVRVNLGHGRNTAAPPATWHEARSATGDPIRIRYSVLPNGVLKMESVSDGGSGRHTFRVSGDGSLRHEVRIESARLPRDVRYTLSYRRRR